MPAVLARLSVAALRVSTSPKARGHFGHGHFRGRRLVPGFGDGFCAATAIRITQPTAAIRPRTTSRRRGAAHVRLSAGFIIITSAFSFSVHTATSITVILIKASCGQFCRGFMDHEY